MASAKPVKNTGASTPGQKAAATKAAKKNGEAKAAASETIEKPKAAKKATPAAPAKEAPKKQAAPEATEVEGSEQEVEANGASVMGRKELAELLRGHVKEAGFGMSDKMALQVVKSFEEVVADAVGARTNIVLPGFGKFVTTDVPEREGRNPKTGETMTIGASVKVSFKPGRALKDAANGMVEEAAS